MARGFRIDEPMTPLERIGNYNNFYEFTTDKEGVAAAAAGFVARPWTVGVEGMVHKPKIFDLDEVLQLGPLEERVYRMRCVEGWSMVIPWAGLPLARLLDRVEPMGSASMSRSKPCSIPPASPAKRGRSCIGPTSKGCGWMKPCIRSLSLRPASTAASCRPRMAPRCGWWFHGSMGSKGSSRSSRSHSCRISRRRPGTSRAVRIRLLLERQPGRPPSALEPGDRAADRRIRPPADAVVQRLRRTGRPPLRGHGPAGQFLARGRAFPMSLVSRDSLQGRMNEPGVPMKIDRFTKSVVLLNCLVPVTLLGWDAWGGKLGANPVNFAIRTTGMLSLLFLVLSLTVTPASRITGWGWLVHFRRMLGLIAFFHAALHFLLFFVFDRGG